MIRNEIEGLLLPLRGIAMTGKVRWIRVGRKGCFVASLLAMTVIVSKFRDEIEGLLRRCAPRNDGTQKISTSLRGRRRRTKQSPG
jgi:hypothetical protein